MRATPCSEEIKSQMFAEKQAAKARIGELRALIEPLEAEIRDLRKRTTGKAFAKRFGLSESVVGKVIYGD